MSDAKIQIANTTDVLEGTKVTTLAGDNLFREGVVVSDPIVGEARARCLNDTPASNEYGMSVRQVGPVSLDEATLAALETVNVGNTVAVAGPLTNAELRAAPVVVSGALSGDHRISTLNSTTTPLGINQTFTGPYENMEPYVSVLILVNTDRLASLNNVMVDFSTDGVNLDRSIPITFQTGGDFASFPCEAKFFRLRIINGPIAQTYLRAQVQYNAVAESPKLIPLSEEITNSDAALVTKGSIIGRSSAGGGTFVDVKVNPSGSLQVVPEGLPALQSGIALSGRPDVTVEGTVSGTTSVVLNASAFGSLSSFSFEALGFTTGTFVIERTLAADPTSGSAFWTAIGAFKAGTRRAGSTWVNEPGAFHGNLSASTGVRIRFTVAPNTTASIRILGSIGTGTITIGAIANNPDNIIGAVSDLGQYYAASFGGRVIFNASTGDSTGLTGTTVVNLAWLRNPVGSGVDMFIYRIFLGASATVKFRRYRNGSPAVSGSPTPPTRFNRGGGANTSQGILYKQAQFTYTPLEANLGKVSYVPASGTDADPVNGSIVLRPGESLVWTVAGTSGLGGAYEASVEAVWWEQAAAA